MRVLVRLLHPYQAEERVNKPLPSSASIRMQHRCLGLTEGLSRVIYTGISTWDDITLPCRSECNHRLPKARIPTIYSIYYQAQIPHILLCLSLLPQSTSFSHAYIIRQDEQNSHSDRPGDGQLPSLFHVLSMVRQIRYDADSTSRSDVHGVSLFHQPILYNTLQESQYLPSPLSLRAVITILVIHSVPVLTKPPF